MMAMSGLSTLRVVKFGIGETKRLASGLDIEPKFTPILGSKTSIVLYLLEDTEEYDSRTRAEGGSLVRKVTLERDYLEQFPPIFAVPIQPSMETDLLISKFTIVRTVSIV